MIKYNPNWKLPWWTGGAVEFVEKHLKECSEPRVFEYGSGMSSKWLADRCSYQVSIENDKTWYDRVDGLISGDKHAKVRLLEGRNYINAIKGEKGLFDVVIIDGVHRRDTLATALHKVVPGGCLVVDDAQAEVYWGMQRLLASWVRHAFITNGKDQQHAGKVTMVYVNEKL